MHTIVIRPKSTDTPSISGILVHSIQVAQGVELVTESTAYLREIARVCNERADRIESLESPETDAVDAKEPAELQHPGTWLPGDQFVDNDGDTWTRGETSYWSWSRPAPAEYVSSESFTDATVNHDYFDENRKPRTGTRIFHLVPRENGAV